jgi:hypothetical protein
MDYSKYPIFSNELSPQLASDRPSAVDGLPADLVSSRTLVARERYLHSDQITPWQNGPSRGASTIVYCGSEERVREGFLSALKAMGVAVVEEPAAAAKAPFARDKS